MTTVTRQTRLIHSESGTYPLFLTDLSAFAPNTSFGPTSTAEILIEFGLEVVTEVSPPVNDVVTEGPPEEVNGEWRQTWISRTFSEVEMAEKLATAKALLQTQAETMRIAMFDRGFPHTFGENVYHVQIRNADRANLTGLRIIAKEMVEANVEQTFSFRVYENVVVDISAAEMVEVANAAFTAANLGYKKTWDVKDAARDATTIEELPTLPTEEDFFTA
jgi:hypothetical protein